MRRSIFRCRERSARTAYMGRTWWKGSDCPSAPISGDMSGKARYLTESGECRGRRANVGTMQAGYQPLRRLGGRVRGLLIVGVLLASLGAACSSDKDGEVARVTTTTTMRPSTTSTVDVRDAIEAAYLAGWDKFVWFGSKEGLESPELAGLEYPDQFRKTFGNYLTGQRYKDVFEALQPIRADSEFRGGRAAIANDLRIVSIEQARAVIRDCYDDNLQTWQRNSSTRLDRDDPDRHLIEVTMVMEDGQWKAATSTPMGDGCTEP